MNRFRFALLAVALVVGLVATASFASPLRHDKRAATGQRFGWYIISFDFANNSFKAGGIASASAADGSKITISNSQGTFGGKPTNVTGGGSWKTSDAKGAETGSGTFKVTSLVYYVGAPGSLPSSITDNIGNPADARAGVGVLKVSFSDGQIGILIITCRLPAGSPPWISEKILMTKGNVDYTKGDPPVAGVDANRNQFRVVK